MLIHLSITLSFALSNSLTESFADDTRARAEANSKSTKGGSEESKLKTDRLNKSCANAEFSHSLYDEQHHKQSCEVNRRRRARAVLIGDT